MSNPNVPEMIVKDISDMWARENFARLQRFMKSFPFFRGQWEFFELTFTSAVTNKKIPHALGFKPTDVMQTSILGAGGVTWNYNLFDSVNLDITTTGPCVVRAFIGAYREN